MNIFYLDENLELNARYHVDKHVVKMITEQNSLLSSVHLLSGGEAPSTFMEKEINQSGYNYYIKRLTMKIINEGAGFELYAKGADRVVAQSKQLAIFAEKLVKLTIN